MTPPTVFERLALGIVALQRADAPTQRQAEQSGIERILATARHVPFYRQLYAQAGVRLDQIRDANDLWQLPAVTKEDLCQPGAPPGIDERLDPTELGVRTTSGSLGAPLPLYHTAVEGAQLYANLHSAWIEQGVTRSDRLLMLLGPYLEWPPPGWNTRWIPASMRPQDVVREFTEFAPTVLIGSTEAIALLGSEVHRNPSLRQNAARVRAVFPFGQTLSLELRTMIQRGFSAPVFDLYGAQEGIWLGAECEQHQGLHVRAGQVIVQIARFGQPNVPAAAGELGEIILTSLVRSTSPIIRYRMHDVARLDASLCSCGRDTPRLVSLEGRVQDFLVSADGRLVPPGNVCSELSQHKSVIDHRIVQESLQHARVQLVVQGEFGAVDVVTVQSIVGSHLGAVGVEVQLVAEIERDPSGKRRRAHRAFPLPERCGF